MTTPTIITTTATNSKESTKQQQRIYLSYRSLSMHLNSLTSPRASDVANRPPSSERQQDVTSTGEVVSAGHMPLTWSLQRPDHVEKPATGSTTCILIKVFFVSGGASTSYNAGTTVTFHTCCSP